MAEKEDIEAEIARIEKKRKPTFADNQIKILLTKELKSLNRKSRTASKKKAPKRGRKRDKILSYETRESALIEQRYWGGHRGEPDFSGKLRIRSVRLNRGGYDTYGQYFGEGEPVFLIESDDGEISHHVRAPNRSKAKAIAREMYPLARF